MSAENNDSRMEQSAPVRRSVAILLSVPEELKERMVDVVAWTQPYTGINTQQTFIRQAITNLCEQLERQYNAGEHFEARAIRP